MDARFVIKNGVDEQMLKTTKITSGWKYISITMDESEVKLYVNGSEVASSSDMNLRPSDFHPAMCYLGRSQNVAHPLWKGRLDDFRIYNYALTPEEIQFDMTGIADGLSEIDDERSSAVVATEYYSLSGNRIDNPQNGIVIVKRRYADGRTDVMKRIFNGE
jgi:hypothetical protein